MICKLLMGSKLLSIKEFFEFFNVIGLSFLKICGRVRFRARVELQKSQNICTHLKT